MQDNKWGKEDDDEMLEEQYYLILMALSGNVGSLIYKKCRQNKFTKGTKSAKFKRKNITEENMIISTTFAGCLTPTLLNFLVQKYTIPFISIL
jgi:hypothetical protein